MLAKLDQVVKDLGFGEYTTSSMGRPSPRLRSLHQNVTIPQSLINDNWYGYLEWWIYREKVTWMEKTVAIPYWTGMTLFSIDRRQTQRRPKHNLLDAIYASHGRVLFEGQLFSAPMNWENLLEQLRKLEEE